MTGDERYNKFFMNIWNNKPYSIDLHEFNQLVRLYENGEITFKRYPEQISNWLKGCSQTLKSAALLLRGCPRTLSEVREIYAYSDLSDDGIEQEELLESWAKAEGIWIESPETYLSSISSFRDKGTECVVFFDKKGPIVHKIMTLKNYIVPRLAIDRIVIHNYLFDSTALTVTGFGRDSNGRFVILADQSLADGRRSTQEERNGLMEVLGFRPTEEGCGVNFENDELFVGDLHEENLTVVDSDDGKKDFYIIDSDCRLNTPSLGCGGRFITSDYSLIEPKEEILQSPDFYF